jgi:hypothetical protein
MNYRNLRPGDELAPWNAKTMELTDRVGNLPPFERGLGQTRLTTRG